MPSSGDDTSHRFDGAHVIGTLAIRDPASGSVVYLKVDGSNGLLVNGSTIAGGGVSPALYTAKGSLLGASGASTPVELLVGSNGQTLVADSTASSGLNWATPTVDIPKSLVTTKGDLIVTTGASTPARLAVGMDGQILTADAASAGGVKWGPATPHTDTILYAADYGATMDGSTNDTTAIQNCINAVAALGGGIAQLSAGTASVTGLTLKSNVWLRGMGWNTTTLYLRNSSNTHVVKNYVSADGVEANAQRVRLSDVYIDGNKSNNASGGHGVFLSCFPLSTKATNDVWFDPHNLVHNVYVANCKQSGVWAEGRSEMKFYGVVSNRCDQYGFRCPYDSFLTNCTASYAGLTGFYCIETNCMMTACKAFLCGQITAGSGHGFRIYNTVASGCVDCIAQDNLANGFVLESLYGGWLTGCSADSNSVSSAGSFVGYDLFDAHYCKIVGCDAHDRRNDGVNTYQTKALQIRSATDYCTIDINHYGYNSAAISSAPVRSTPAVGNGNLVTINGSTATRQQTVTYAASITPNPWSGEEVLVGALTGNITINAPANSPWLPGTRLRFVFTQDGTGSRTLTWNSTFKSVPSLGTAAANTRATVEFSYNGTDWTCINAVGWT